MDHRQNEYIPPKIDLDGASPARCLDDLLEYILT